MRVGILQPGYLPWLGFFEQMLRVDLFIFYDDVQFEKGSWRNRNRIKGPNGPVWLTVPVLTKGHRTQLIKDLKINNRVRWQTKHIKSIRQSYAKTRFFKDFFPAFSGIVEREDDSLLQLDLSLIQWVCDALGIQTKTVLSSDLNVEGTGQQRLIDIINSLGGDAFYEGTAGRDYIDTKKFKDAGIDVIYQDYKHPVYEQLYGGFISHLSVIDLLFNHGQEGQKILRNLK
jgi:hypothetical protein